MDYLAASLAHVRFFTGVDASMDCQCRSLDELLVTPWMVTDVRPDTTMYSFCTITLASGDTMVVRMVAYRDAQGHFAEQSLCHRSRKQKPSPLRYYLRTGSHGVLGHPGTALVHTHSLSRGCLLGNCLQGEKLDARSEPRSHNACHSVNWVRVA